MKTKELDKALDRGWQLIPLNGKHPIPKAWQLGAKDEQDKIQKALEARAHAEKGGNLGVLTGKPSGIIVIDIDAHSGATLTPADFPSTVTAITGKAGYHLFSKRPDVDFMGNARKAAFPTADHVDIRGDGGQVVMVGSIHPETKKAYKWMDGHSPEDMPFAEFPADILALLQAAQLKPKVIQGPYKPWDASKGTHPWIAGMLRNMGEKLASCSSNRNDELNNCALILGHYCPEYLSPDEIEGALIPAMDANGYIASDGMYAVRATIASGLNAGMRTPMHPPEKERKQYKENKSVAVMEKNKDVEISKKLPDSEPRTMAAFFLENCDSKSLAFWMDSFWEYSQGAYQPIKDTAVEVKIRNGLEGCTVPVYDKKNDFWEDKKLVVKKTVVSEVFAAVLAQDGVYLNENCTAPMWRNGRKDNPRDIFTARNGLFNLKTGEFSPHDASFFNLGASDFDFDRDAKCPQWEAWLETVFVKDKRQILLLQEWFGYCLTYDCSQRKVMLLLGITTSGKGTIMNVLTSLLGRKNMASVEPADTLGNFFGSTIFGKRLLNFFDLRMGGRLDTAAFGAMILKLAEGAPLKIEAKNKDAFTAPTVAKVTIASNNLPRFIDSSSAVAGRFLTLRFTESFLGKEDKGLDARLNAELPGIFLWSLAGLERLQDNGWRWTEHDAGISTRNQMADECSPVKRFVDEECILNPSESIGKMVLFNAWKEYCKERNIQAIGTDSTFSTQLHDAFPFLGHGEPKEAITRKSLPRTHTGIRLKFDFEK